MQLVCSRCSRIVEYSGERPSFCGFCGSPLAREEATAEFTAKTVLTPTAPLAPLLVGVDGNYPQKVGGYRLLRQLGSGGMGAVFEAEDSSSGRHVAVKLIAPDFTTSTDAVERFRQEGRLASTIAHPRCVFVLAADEEGGRPYIVMELMPGSTLKDMISAQGPLMVTRAVSLILDVIEGLQEAHAHGVIHRDVKPSNCFLQADGRVKIGDFGLSKSLSRDVHLTRTGTFLGTPLFASPEQVRSEPLDPRTDVYSAAATLYYLLVGRAPFQSSDAASTLARLVSEAPPSMRTLRREVPAALDRVVLRGLERQRERRWQNLEELRSALLPFVPGKLSFGGMGIRFGAYLLDFLILIPVNVVITFVVMLLWLQVPAGGSPALAEWAPRILSYLGVLLYFGVVEGRWGTSLGKWWLNLRVCGREGGEPPGLLRGCLRASFFFACMNIPSIAFSWFVPAALLTSPWWFIVSPLLATMVSVLLVISTMRARNGYRGPYELLSGTRVIQLPWRKRRRRYQGSWDVLVTKAGGLPRQIGPFTIHGVLRREDQETLLVGADKSLGRQVWLWLRPASRPPLSPARREVGRATRLRWLVGGEHEGDQWDAFLAPPGCLLVDAVAADGKFTWTEAQPILEELADELAHACSDGTLPAPLPIEQIWVQPSGRVQLLEFPARADGTDRNVRPTAATDEQAALAFLGQVAALVLEGKRRAAADHGPIRAPLPPHVGRFLHRLTGLPDGYGELKQFQADLASTHDWPTEVTPSRRAAHLVVLGFLLMSGCTLIPLLSSPQQRYVGLLAEHTRAAHNAVAQLELDLLASLLNPDALVRLRGVGQWCDDVVLRARLRDKAAEWEMERMLWLPTLSLTQQLMESEGFTSRTLRVKDKDPRPEARNLLNAELRSQVDAESLLLRGLGLVGLGPLAWIVWGFVTRGGLSLRFTGIRVVRADGRKAARWQCALRALLFWLPVTLLLMTSVVLNCWFWSFADPRISGWPGSLPLLSTLAWWLGVLLLPLYAVPALLSPTRSLHDVLAGTQLVPR